MWKSPAVTIAKRNSQVFFCGSCELNELGSAEICRKPGEVALVHKLHY